MGQSLIADIIAIAQLVTTDPIRAADQLDLLAKRLTYMANQLREADGTRSTSGVGDRVQMAVVGPDGQVKQQTDTGL